MAFITDADIKSMILIAKTRRKKFECTVIKTFQFMQTVIISFEGRL